MAARAAVFGPELGPLSTALSAVHSARPLTSGAVVVTPRRAGVQRLSELPAEEAADLFTTAGRAAAATEGGADAFNWSARDSWPLGAEPAPLHLHVVPRRDATAAGMWCANFRENDEVYSALEAWHPSPGVVNVPAPREWPDDASRTNRTADEMAAEAQTYRAAAWPEGEGAPQLPESQPFARFTLPQSQLFWASIDFTTAWASARGMARKIAATTEGECQKACGSRRVDFDA